jgi:hypothetical protein
LSEPIGAACHHDGGDDGARGIVGYAPADYVGTGALRMRQSGRELQRESPKGKAARGNARALIESNFV